MLSHLKLNALQRSRITHGRQLQLEAYTFAKFTLNSCGWVANCELYKRRSLFRKISRGTLVDLCGTIIKKKNMKRGMQLLAVMGVIALSTVGVMGQEDKKAAEARKDLTQAQQDLKEAKIDSAADYMRFKKEADLKIQDNQVKIMNLKEKKSQENQDVKDRYDKRVLALEQSNNDLKLRMTNSGKIKTSNWTKFKREFNQDMDNLWEAIKDVGDDSSK